MSTSEAGITTITSPDAFHAHLSSLSPSTPVIISFHTPWATPCKQHAQILSALASTYSSSTAAGHPPSFVVLDAEELPEISEDYDVTAVPFIVIQRDGNVLGTISGADASRIREAVERYVGAPSSASATVNGHAAPATMKLPEKLSAERSGENEAAVPNGNTATAADGESAVNKDELHARLAELVKAAPVMLFMKGTPSAPQCGFSRTLVGMLRGRGVRYGFFNILADDDVRQGLKEFSDWPTFPQLYLQGEFVGGLDIVKEELETNPEFFAEVQAPAKDAPPDGQKEAVVT